jgi:hypothetical protein
MIINPNTQSCSTPTHCDTLVSGAEPLISEKDDRAVLGSSMPVFPARSPFDDINVPPLDPFPRHRQIFSQGNSNRGGSRAGHVENRTKVIPA